MIVYFTICSANYLAQAITLGDSLQRTNPNRPFVIGLVDDLTETIRRRYRASYELLPVAALSVPNFDGLASKYDVVELNTAVKPYYFQHLYERDHAVTSIIYLDPDMLVLGSFTRIEQLLATHNLVLTPHSCTIDDSRDCTQAQREMLASGIYNLGFLGTTRSAITLRFLRWWQTRLQEYCYRKVTENLFVDQLWVNLAPVYFPGVHVETGLGYNVCYWNLFERIISKKGEQHWVNGDAELVFYHFSSYDPNRDGDIDGRWHKKLDRLPEMKSLFDTYRQALIDNGYFEWRAVPSRFAHAAPPVQEKPAPAHSSGYQLKKAVAWILNRLPAGLKQFIRRGAFWVGLSIQADARD